MSQERQSELAPCPFCGAGTFEIHPNGQVWTGQKFSEPASVSVRHWCEAVNGQPARMIERVGRDEDSAIAAWNHRVVPPSSLALVNEMAEAYLTLIREMAQAYPLEVFPELSANEWSLAKDALAGAGISLDRVSASNMRHMIARVNTILHAKRTAR